MDESARARKRNSRRAVPADERPENGYVSDVPERIIEASRLLLMRGGLEALTLSAIAEEADVYISAVNYHFGNKEMLKATVIERVLRDAMDALRAFIGETAPGEQRVTETLQRFDMIGGEAVQQGFFETFGAALRDPALHARLANLYDEARGLFEDVLATPDGRGRERLRPYALILLAFLDGLGVQQLIDPDLDVSVALSAMAHMISTALSELAASDEEGSLAT
jgi:AcrR family transcriptional regulator